MSPAGQYTATVRQGFLRHIGLHDYTRGWSNGFGMDCDVIIVGGGLVGASLALALRAARLRVALIEAHVLRPYLQDTSWGQRIYAISPGSAALLESCGV